MVVFIPLYVQLIKIIAVIVVVILLIIGVFVFIIPLFKPKDAAAYAKKNEYTDCVEKERKGMWRNWIWNRGKKQKTYSR